MFENPSFERCFLFLRGCGSQINSQTECAASNSTCVRIVTKPVFASSSLILHLTKKCVADASSQMFHLLNKSLKGRKENRESASSSTTAMLINKLSLPSFPQFEKFDDDIRKLILSYVAEAPFEKRLGEYQQSALTSTLPLVNKEFKRWSELDYFWEPTLKRQTSHDFHGILWKQGLKHLLPSNHELSNSDDDEDEPINLERMIGAIREHSQTHLAYRDIYRKVLTSHIYFEAPVFMMPCQLQIGELYGLHLFEPRYRVMVHDLIAACDNPIEAANGGKIRIGTQDGVRQPPLLIHACLGRAAPGELACLVQLVWCQIYENRTADVRLLPIAWVKLDRIWIRRNAGNLFYSKAWRLPPNSIRIAYSY